MRIDRNGLGRLAFGIVLFVGSFYLLVRVVSAGEATVYATLPDKRTDGTPVLLSDFKTIETGHGDCDGVLFGSTLYPSAIQQGPVESRAFTQPFTDLTPGWHCYRVKVTLNDGATSAWSNTGLKQITATVEPQPPLLHVVEVFPYGYEMVTRNQGGLYMRQVADVPFGTPCQPFRGDSGFGVVGDLVVVCLQEP